MEKGRGKRANEGGKWFEGRNIARELGEIRRYGDEIQMIPFTLQGKTATPSKQILNRKESYPITKMS